MTSTTIAADPVTPDPDDDGSGMPALSGVIEGQCPRKPWCVRGAGHPGFCGKRPKGEGRAPRTRTPRTPSTSSRARTSTPARRGSSKPSGLRPLIALAWGGIGQVVEAYAPEPSGPPVGRVMQFQAPYAAGVLDKVLMERVPAYKAIDAMTGGILDELGPVLLPPLIVAVMASRPESQGALYPMLAGQLEQIAIAVTAERQRVRDALSQAAELDAESAQLVNELTSMLFAPRPSFDDMPDEGGVEGAWPTA